MDIPYNVPLGIGGDVQRVQLGIQTPRAVDFGLGVGVYTTGTSDYEELENKPQINSVELVGNKSWQELGMPTDVSISYDESCSVGYAVVGDAVTAQPLYTPTGTVEVTTDDVEVLTGAHLVYTTYNRKLILQDISTTATNVSKVTGAAFTGNGVSFVGTLGE